MLLLRRRGVVLGGGRRVRPRVAERRGRGHPATMRRPGGGRHRVEARGVGGCWRDRHRSGGRIRQRRRALRLLVPVRGARAVSDTRRGRGRRPRTRRLAGRARRGAGDEAHGVHCGCDCSGLLPLLARCAAPAPPLAPRAKPRARPRPAPRPKRPAPLCPRPPPLARAIAAAAQPSSPPSRSAAQPLSRAAHPLMAPALGACSARYAPHALLRCSTPIKWWPRRSAASHADAATSRAHSLARAGSRCASAPWRQPSSSSRRMA